MPRPLHVPGFSGGVVLEGAADTQRVDELQACDGYDIGARGQLIAASDFTDYVTINDNAPNRLVKCFRMAPMSGAKYAFLLAVGEGVMSAAQRYVIASMNIDGAASPVGGASVLTIPNYDNANTRTPFSPGVIVTFARFPGIFYVWTGGAKVGVNIMLVNVGQREGFATFDAGLGAGLYAFLVQPPNTVVGIFPIGQFDALGTGAMGQQTIASAGATPGTHGVPLFFRGIAAYNGIAMGWGHDQSDAVNFDGPARLMFSNLSSAAVAGPLTWGNDNISAAGDRQFTDSDAVIIGDAGERIRAGLTWNKRFWVGTNRGLHYLAGYGRNSFTTDGANPVAKAENVIGPYALIEGPDGLLYGVGDQGLWRFDGASFERLHKRLRRFDTHSPGWWDLIWTDRNQAFTWPSVTNQDLVWLAVDWDLEQVIVGIPWCNANNGYGRGNDTVLIKYHVRTGGFTRQVFTGVQYTAAEYVRREGQYNSSKFAATSTALTATIRRYAYQTAQNISPALPTPLPTTTVGEYAQFGPNGVGIYRKVYLTLSWESVASLPLSFLLFPSVDQQQVTNILVTIAAVAPLIPLDGDLWLDTSGTDPNLGNNTSGTLIVASHDYILKAWRASKATWQLVGGSGQKGIRATIPIAFTPTRGSRFKVQITTLSAAGRWQLEGIADQPTLVTEGS